MTRIEWTRKSPDDIEEAVSMFVCRINPRAFRVRPSKGDGGIDVCVPIASNHFEVYQVKRFSTNLGDNQKKQAEKSHSRLKRYAEDRGWKIDRWLLTMPLDPTNENLTWLKKLESSGPFPCEWRGLSTLDGWAAQFPDVVDYYFNDGRERLAEELARFSALSGISIGSGLLAKNADYTTLEPSDVQDGVARLREALNQRDPHYLYDFAVTGSLPALPAEILDTLVASETREIDGSYVTFNVHARCAESLNERPITVSMQLVAETGSDRHRELDEFLKYGRTPDRPIRAKDVSVDLPGGLGMKDGLAEVLIHDMASHGEPFERRLSILSPTDEVVTSVDLTMYPPVSNHNGTGNSNRGHDSTGVLQIETLTTSGPPIEMTLRLSRGDIAGHYPDKIEPVLSVIEAFRSPNRFRLQPTRGSAGGFVETIPPSETDDKSRELNRIFLRYTRALVVIQQYTVMELKVPEFETLEDLNVENVLRAAKLLNGETVEIVWKDFQMVLNHGASLPGGPVSVVVEQDLSVEVGTVQIDLGQVRVVIEAAQVVSSEIDSNGQTIATVEPALGKNGAQLFWLGEASINHVEDGGYV